MIKNIGILGFGNMGRAFYSAIQQAYPETHFFICDKTDSISSITNITNNKAEEVIKQSDIIIIAVKPQNLTALANSVENDFHNKIIISIMAGVKIKKIYELTGSDKIVRAMPNICIKNSLGVIGWKASPKISAVEKSAIKNIFASTGLEIELASEEQINAITALSGSGPAYFYHLGTAMILAAEKLGFSKATAEKIIQQTFLGSAKMLAKEKKTFSELEKVITSKGGTTEAAINYFEQNNFNKTIDGGIAAANKRAEELSA